LPCRPSGLPNGIASEDNAIRVLCDFKKGHEESERAKVRPLRRRITLKVEATAAKSHEAIE
jgi:hypothetical protein